MREWVFFGSKYHGKNISANTNGNWGFLSLALWYDWIISILSDSPSSQQYPFSAEEGTGREKGREGYGMASQYPGNYTIKRIERRIGLKIYWNCQLAGIRMILLLNEGNRIRVVVIALLIHPCQPLSSSTHSPHYYIVATYPVSWSWSQYDNQCDGRLINVMIPVHLNWMSVLVLLVQHHLIPNHVASNLSSDRGQGWNYDVI